MKEKDGTFEKTRMCAPRSPPPPPTTPLHLSVPLYALILSNDKHEQQHEKELQSAETAAWTS